MGYTRHHAIVVTSFSEETIAAAHAKAEALKMSVTPIVVTQINAYHSFLIGPDGSKEWWADSDEGDRRRQEYVTWLRAQAYEDGSSPLAWVEVQYGDGDGVTLIVDHSDA